MRSGKVRDLYDADGNYIIVSSDRISAFDCVLPTPIPDKGKILNTLSVFWFARTGPYHRQSPGPAPRSGLSSSHTTLWRRVGRTLHAGASRAGHSHRVRGARLSGRFRLEGISKSQSVMRHSAAQRPAESDAVPYPIFHNPLPKLTAGQTRPIRFDGVIRIDGLRALPCSRATGSLP
jgi:phosphoribosylaminoimidazole-succinocarboxamide synthase